MLNERLLGGLPVWLRNYDYSRYLSDNYIVLDFETTNLDKGSPYNVENRIVCSSYILGPDHPGRTRDTVPGYCEGSEFSQQELIRYVEAADFWVAHNSKFEYGWLERCGLPLDKTLTWCTQIAEYIIKSNRYALLNLDACLARRGLGSKEVLGSKLLKGGVCPSTWPEEWLKPYSIKDVVQGEKLFLNQREYLIKSDQLKTLFTRCILTPVLVDIERNGMHLDKERVEIVYKKYAAERERLQMEIDKLTGGANPRSHPQMRKVLYEDFKFAKPKIKKWLTGKGLPTTKFDYIGTLTPKTVKAKKFVAIKREFSKVDAALTKALTKFLACVTETKDHILTASMNQTITATQRLSSTGRNYAAQFQNFPRIFKPLFSARKKGWLLGEIDQAQLEYRVAVWYGQDKAGFYDIEHGVDSHAYTASKIYGVSFTEMEASSTGYKGLRTSAKAHTFKPLYGGESGTKDEVRYYKAFKEKHSGITGVQEEWKMEALNTQKVKCPNGLIFYFPGTRINAKGYMTNTTNICNYNVQSLATADIVPVGLVYMWHLMKAAKLESYIINTVHDSVIIEINPEEIEIISEFGELSSIKVVKEYLEKIYNIDFNVPLEIESKFETHWSNTPDWENKYLKQESIFNE